MIKWWLAGVSTTAFIAYVWWASWFLREGPNGPNGWTFMPVLVTGMILLVGTVVLLSRLED